MTTKRASGPSRIQIERDTTMSGAEALKPSGNRGAKTFLWAALMGLSLCVSGAAMAHSGSTLEEEMGDNTVVAVPDFLSMGGSISDDPLGSDATSDSEHANDTIMEIVPVSGSDTLITLSGHLFYEDHRKHGAFDLRQDRNGRTAVTKGSRTTDSQWHLAAYRMVVDIYEHDRNWVRIGCKTEDLVTSATVRADGSFSATFSFSDDCRGGDWSSPKFSLRARTRFCGSDVCYQVGPKKSSHYELSFRKNNPIGVSHGNSHDFGYLFFTPAGEPAKNDHSRAANNYASLVDAVVTLHDTEGVPFRKSEYGTVHVRFPSRRSDGRCTDYDLIDMNSKGWPLGNKMIHEYGHIIQRRAWGGDYAGHHDPIQSWSGGSMEIPFIAFKEGWANFVFNYVTGKCDGRSRDTDYDFHSTDRGENGNKFVENHTRFFCDWVDENRDTRPGMYGAGDIIETSMWSLWSSLDLTDETVSQYGGHDPVDPGLGICDFVGNYLEVQKSVGRVGQSSHDQHLYAVASLLEQHDMKCADVPHPTELREHNFAATTFPTAVDDSGLDARQTGQRVVSMEVTVANVHPFITTDSGVLSVWVFRSDGSSELIHLKTIYNLAAGETVSANLDVVVEMVNGAISPVIFEVKIIDTMDLDIDLSDNTESFVLDETTLRPNLKVSAKDIDFDGPEGEFLSFVAVVTNNGLIPAELGTFGSFSTNSLYEVAESTGLVHMTNPLFGTLEVGEVREVPISVELSAEVRTGFLTWLNVSIDVNDVVSELRTGDNSTQIIIVMNEFYELPTDDFMVQPSSELVRSSMWIQELQRDLMTDFMWEPVSWWAFYNPVDQAIARQLAESHIVLGVEPATHSGARSTVFVNPTLAPAARSQRAVEFARTWRAMP